MRPSLTISEAGVFVLLLGVLPLLLRSLLAIPVIAPLDPNEGWNAAHALALMAGQPLYPPPQSLMVNNYPPLSFYLVGGLARHSHDPILIGRWLSMLAFVTTGAGIAAALRLMRCHWAPAAFGGLFFAAALLTTSDYVGMDDPQLLGHALQVIALILLLREKLVVAAALFAVSLFVKHNLLALPLAGALWLIWQDYRSGFSFLLWTAATVLALLISFISISACWISWHRRGSGPSPTSFRPARICGGCSCRWPPPPASGPTAPACFAASMAPSRWCWGWALPAAMAWTPMASSTWPSPCPWRLGWRWTAAAGPNSPRHPPYR